MPDDRPAQVLDRMVMTLAPPPAAPATTCIFIAGLMGHPLAFRPVARRIADRHACLGLLHPALAGGGNSRPSARQTIDKMETALARRGGIDPDIPQIYAGYSLGGGYAYELARRARAEGRDAAAILIDANLPRLRTKRWLRYLKAVLTDHISFLSPRPDPAQRRPELGLMERDQVLSRYYFTPRRSQTPIALFLSETGEDLEHHLYRRDAGLGWRRIAPVTATIHGAGDHLGMFKPPHEAAFAEQLNDLLMIQSGRTGA